MTSIATERYIAIQWLVVSSITFCLVACEPAEDTELTHYINSVKMRPGQPIEPIPEYVPLAKYIYPENDNRRSPFKPKEDEKVDNRLAPNTKRPKQPLEQFPLDALKFVGVLKQGSMIWGLVSQPNGNITKVKTGDYMGKNFGKVILIDTKSLTIEETVQVTGKWERKKTVFNLNASK